MAPQAFVMHVALAVKNGPAGMWRALSNPAHIAPYGPLPWWLWPVAVALVAVGARYARRSLAGRPQGRPRWPSGDGQVVDLGSRRRARGAQRDHPGAR